MTEPPKRTKLRSSPEDAAFYREYHDAALGALRGGDARQHVLEDLISKGVPENTARRIVIAVEQELALQTEGVSPPGRKWKILAVLIAIWGSIAGYMAWQISKEGMFHWRILAGAGAIATVLTYRMISRSIVNLGDPPAGPGGR